VTGVLDERPDTTDDPGARPAAFERGELVPLLLVFLPLLLLLAFRDQLAPFVTGPAISTWFAIFLSICIQALPFLGLGVLVSALITAFVPSSFFAKALPERPVAAVPVASAAGVFLPGCECGSVPVAGGLVARGVTPAAAFAFLLSAPAINPVVLVATAVAFPGSPEMVLARLVASYLVAVVVGLTWIRYGRAEWISRRRRPHVHEGAGRGETFLATARHDFSHAGGFLVVGGLTAATLSTLVPRSVLDAVGGQLLLGVLALAALAVVLSICSEADAFVAASLVGFSPVAQLAFMVVGPAVDVKLVALQSGTFGRRFAARFAPYTFVVAVLMTLTVGSVLL
jgi:uncharacterized membrane protein YraQ (UPF0718 family)